MRTRSRHSGQSFRPASRRCLARAARSNFESLETRRLLALLGVEPGYPMISTEPGDSDALTYVYNPTTGSFQVSTTLLNYQDSESDPQALIIGGSFDLAFLTSNTGALLGGVPGDDDFELTGGIDLNGNFIIDGSDPSGVLLTGEILAFGFEDNPPGDSTTHLFDFRLSVTGGLLASKFSGSDIAITLTSEDSTYTGDFKSDFSGNAKANVGPIPNEDEEEPLSSIAGVKYRDLSGDGINAGDTPLGGFTINLYQDNGVSGVLDGADVLLASDISDNTTGEYFFGDLEPGSYIIQEVVPAGYAQTAPAGGIHAVELPPDVETHVTGKDFANFENIDLRGKKFKDITGNGISGDDLPLQGTTIQLFKNDVLVDSTQTGADGSYAFTNLGPGKYSVKEVVPTGWYQTGGPVLGYNIDPAIEDRSDLNFANARFTKITGKKVKDRTGNGLSADDTALGGVKIKLYKDVNGDGKLTSADGAAIDWTYTAYGSGEYCFDGLKPGKYLVQEVVPDGYVRTAPQCEDYYAVTTTSCDDSYGNDFANFDKKDCDCLSVTCISYTINGTKVVTDLRGNTNEGDIVTVKFTIPKYKTETVTLVSYTAPSAVWDPALAYQQEIFDQDFGTFSGGSSGKTYTLTVQIPNSYYQIDFVCGLAIDRFGKPGSNITYSSQGRLISADNDGKAAVPQGFGQLSGKVFIDKDKDGKLDSGEGGILNVKIQLTGIDDKGRSITLTRYTESDGSYSFKGLRPGTYSIKEIQPTGYNDGAECIGTAGGLKSSNDIFSKILVSFDTDGTGYNFAEIKKY